MKKLIVLFVALFTGVGAVAAAEPAAAKGASEDVATAVMRASFKERGQAKLDRLEQDETMAACSKYPIKMPRAIGQKLEAVNLARIKYPSDGKYLGDWKEGEKIAQTGVGKQFSDDPSKPSGGNCYACHQLTKKEISFGTIGPPLMGYGKIRGYGQDTVRFTWGKVYNSQAYSACSNMPRFGHNGILTEDQIRHVVALLLDPNSPVNQ